MKKAAALLITLLIISSLGLMALVAARSAISGLSRTTRIADELIADQASYAGLELFLVDRGNLSLIGGTYTCNLENDIVSLSDDCTVSSGPTGHFVTIEPKEDTGDGSVRIFSTGRFGNSYKKHLFVIDVADEVRMVY